MFSWVNSLSLSHFNSVCMLIPGFVTPIQTFYILDLSIQLPYSASSVIPQESQTEHSYNETLGFPLLTGPCPATSHVFALFVNGVVLRPVIETKPWESCLTSLTYSPTSPPPIIHAISSTGEPVYVFLTLVAITQVCKLKAPASLACHSVILPNFNPSRLCYLQSFLCPNAMFHLEH